MIQFLQKNVFFLYEKNICCRIIKTITKQALKMGVISKTVIALCLAIMILYDKEISERKQYYEAIIYWMNK